MVGLTTASTTLAEEEEKKTKESDSGKVTESTPYSVSELGLDYDVPESPAFTILNLNPKDITHTAAPRDFAASILNGLDKNGNFQSGLAIDLNLWGIANRNAQESGTGFFSKSPLMLTADRTDSSGAIIRDEGYIDGDFSFSPLDLCTDQHAQLWNTTRWLRYFWYRTSFSFATTKGAEETDQSLRLSGGVQMTPWSLADPRYQVAKCIADKVEQTNQLLSELGTVAADLETRKGSDEVRAQITNLANYQNTPDLETEFKTARLTIQKKLRMECICDEKLCMPIDDSLPRTGADRSTCAASTSLVGMPLHLLQERIADAAKWIKAYEDSKVAIKAEDDAKAIKTASTKEADAKPIDETSSEEEKRKDKVVKAVIGVLRLAGDKTPTKDKNEDQLADLKERAAHRVADKIVDACRDENKDNANYSAWNIAAAPSWISQDGTTGDMRWNGWGIWTSVAIGPDFIERKGTKTNPRSTLGKTMQLILHGRYRFDERVATDKDMANAMANAGAEMPFFDNESWLVGGRLHALAADNWGASIEGAIINDQVKVAATPGTDSGDRPRDDTYYRFAIVPTVRLTDDLWVDVSIGTDVERHNQKGSAFVLSSIKYGYSDAPWGSRGNRQALKP